VNAISPGAATRMTDSVPTEDVALPEPVADLAPAPYDHGLDVGESEPVEATYVLAADYHDWKALFEGYDALRTVMYRKLLLEDGDLLEFFKGIYFFVECLAVAGTVPANYPALAG